MIERTIREPLNHSSDHDSLGSAFRGISCPARTIARLRLCMLPHQPPRARAESRQLPQGLDAGGDRVRTRRDGSQSGRERQAGTGTAARGPQAASAEAEVDLSRRHFSRPTPERCPRDGARRSSREDCDERLGTRDSYCVRQVQYFERFRSENRGGKTCYVSRCKGRLQNDYRSASVAAGKFSTKLIFHILGA